MVIPQLFIKLRHLVQHRALSLNTSTPRAPAPTPKTGSAGTTGTGPDGHHRQPAVQHQRLTQPAQGGQQCIRELGSGPSGGGSISNYELSKRLDGGSWTVVGTYSSRPSAASVSVPAGTETIAFRVRAKDENGYWSDYKTSGAYTVKNNAAPGALGSITVPETVYGGKGDGDLLAAASDPDGNLSGYILERQTDGGSWSQRYKGGRPVLCRHRALRHGLGVLPGQGLRRGKPVQRVHHLPHQERGQRPGRARPHCAGAGHGGADRPRELDGCHPRRRLHAGAQGQHGRRLTQVYSGQALSSSETAGA